MHSYLPCFKIHPIQQRLWYTYSRTTNNRNFIWITWNVIIQSNKHAFHSLRALPDKHHPHVLYVFADSISSSHRYSVPLLMFCWSQYMHFCFECTTQKAMDLDWASTWEKETGRMIVVLCCSHPTIDTVLRTIFIVPTSFPCQPWNSMYIVIAKNGIYSSILLTIDLKVRNSDKN